MQDLRIQINNVYNEKIDEIEGVKSSLNKEWLKKEMTIKLNIENVNND